MGMKGKFLLLCLCAVLLLGGCAPAGESTVPPTTAAPTVEATTLPTTEPVTEPATVPTTEPIPQVILHSGLREDGTFSEGTLFIGDSVTFWFLRNHLQLYELIGDAKFIAVCGIRLNRFFSDQKLGTDEQSSMYSPEFLGMSFREALESMGENATAIYVMVGTNYYVDTDTAHYIEAVDMILQACPNATVQLQKIPVCHLGWVDEDAVNASLEETLAHYQAQGEQRVMLIDVYTAAGYNHWDDGIHLNAEGLKAWYNAIVDHGVRNGLEE